MLKNKPKRVYLDYAATTPIHPEVLNAMLPFLGDEFGNPSSLYKSGVKAKEAVETARQAIASVVGANKSEIIFTAGGTESVNLAILGFARSLSHKAHFITTKIEHHCVLNCFKRLAKEGHKTTFVNVDQNGLVDLEQLKKSVKADTVLISVMYANNEIGTVQPIAEIGKWLRKINHERFLKKLPPVLFHTDACQAAGALELDANMLCVDMMSVNGSKIYGPKQSGFLYKRTGVNLEPIIYGGGQENNLRSGTENVAAIVGLGKALVMAQQIKDKEQKRLEALSAYLINKVRQQIPGVLLNGYGSYKLNLKHNIKSSFIRLPNNTNFTFTGVEGEALMLYLDAQGFEVSTASACSTGDPNEPSHVLLAIGRSKAEAQSSIRVTIGKDTKIQDLKKFLKVLPNLISQLRKIKNK